MLTYKTRFVHEGRLMTIPLCCQSWWNRLEWWWQISLPLSCKCLAFIRWQEKSKKKWKQEKQVQVNDRENHGENQGKNHGKNHGKNSICYSRESMASKKIYLTTENNIQITTNIIRGVLPLAVREVNEGQPYLVGFFFLCSICVLPRFSFFTHSLSDLFEESHEACLSGKWNGIRNEKMLFTLLCHHHQPRNRTDWTFVSETTLLLHLHFIHYILAVSLHLLFFTEWLSW